LGIRGTFVTVSVSSTDGHTVASLGLESHPVTGDQFAGAFTLTNRITGNQLLVSQVNSIFSVSPGGTTSESPKPPEIHALEQATFQALVPVMAAREQTRRRASSSEPATRRQRRSPTMSMPRSWLPAARSRSRTRIRRMGNSVSVAVKSGPAIGSFAAGVIADTTGSDPANVAGDILWAFAANKAHAHLS
jgi:hypothetical protein